MSSVVQPLIFASIAFYMFGNESSSQLLYASIGSGLIGIWTTTLIGSGGAIQNQRYQGTLELLVAAPMPFLVVLLSLTLATATVGLYALVATLLWGRLLFGVPLHFVHPLLMGAAVVTTVTSLGLLGLLLATSFVLYRSANALANMLEYPVWLVSGLLFPVSLLPQWAGVVSWFLAPTWGVTAIRRAALGGDAARPIEFALVLAGAYLVVSAGFLRVFENAARRRGTLPLA